jgi:hypothetical protein
MIQERVRAGLGRAVEGGKRLGRDRGAVPLKNESKANYGPTRAFWRLPGLAVSAGTVQRIAREMRVRHG